ncbi:hypothetical protein NFI96_009202 [Prochilodus magdalenae]|nr:hypothetical protein NFI96_009202 [Prochilodus magdalenae]
MMFLCSLSLFIIMIESCVSQSISPLEENVDAVEGETAALSCRYSGSAYYLYWYRQYPGSRPEFLLRIDPSTKAVRRADPPVPGLDVKLNGNKLDLEISSSKISDSVLYCCALWPTVTRSPSTLYKNSLTDKALRCVWGFLSDVQLSTCSQSNSGGLNLDTERLGYTILTITKGDPSESTACTERGDPHKSCFSQSISPLEDRTQVHAVEGQTVTLSCMYEGNVRNLHWYRQYPGSRPEFLLLKYPTSPDVTRADPPFPRLDAAVNGSVVELKISSAAVSDSALYYCAMEPTVTGNPDTLYTGRADYLYWYRQYPGSRPEFLLRIDPDNNNVLKADPPFPRLDVKLTGTKLDLVISSAEVSDSVLYYCALRPTVTRSPSTLHKNSLTDKAVCLGFPVSAFNTIRPTMRPGEQAGECRGGAPSHQLDYGLSHKQATVCGRYGLCVRYNTLQLREPQGTVLDPFLFTLYTADFTHNITTYLQVFSDDSTTLGYISDGDKSYEGGGGGTPCLYWYRQYPGSRPEFLLLIQEAGELVTKAENLDARMSNKVHKEETKKVDLEISSAAVSDSPVVRYHKSFDTYQGLISISPLEEKVDAVEGETATLSCSYEGGGTDPSLHWYRQYPGSRPEFLLLTSESSGYVNKAEKPDARMSIKVHKEEKKKVDLEISSAAVSDSVLYY